MEANSYQPEGDSHYRKHKIQHWDAVKHWCTPDQYIGYLLCSASKYLARYNDKDGRKGLKKSIHYLQKLLEFLEEQDTNPSRLLLEPVSNNFYTYEGGKSDIDLWRCRSCKTIFEVPMGTLPETVHPIHSYDSSLT